MATKYGGRGDLDRSLELLWGTRKRPSRGPKPGLSVERIVWAAIEVADAEGLASLSMQRVANRLDFTTMSLYRYVPGKGELIELMLDAVFGQPPFPDDEAATWRAKLEWWAREEFAFYHRHPWTLEVAISGPALGPNRIAWLESALQAISGTGLTENEMLSVALLLTGYDRGAAQISVDVTQAERHTGVSAEQWGPVFARLMEKVIDDERYPMLAGVLASGVFDGPDDAPHDDFEFGLQRILDGIAALVEARSPRLDR